MKSPARERKIVTAFTILWVLVATSVLLAGLSADAMPVRTRLMKANAATSQTNMGEGKGFMNLFLDLKSKSLEVKKDIEMCGNQMSREARTLNYSCTLKIPTQAKTSRLQNLITPKMFEVIFGGLKKKVQVMVSSDAREITYSTNFDSTGIDFDVLKFNDDFFVGNAKLAHLILAEAMKQPVRIEVLESRTSLLP